MAVYRPFKRPSGLSRSQALVTTCLIWAIALMLTLPWAVIFNVIPNTDGFELCVETWENEYHGKLYFLLANFLMFYCTPMIIISISNLAIWCHVTHRKVPHDTASVGPIKRMHKKARYGVLKMLGIVTLTFLISWMPLYVIVMRMKFGENISDSELNLLDSLMPFAQWLGSWNSSINPVLYAFLNSKFREMFRSLLPKWCPLVHHRQGNMRIITRRAGEGTEAVSNSTLGVTASNGHACITTVSSAQSSTRCVNNRRHTQNYRNRNATSYRSFHERNSRETETAAVTSFHLACVGVQSNVVRCTIGLPEGGIVTNL